MNKTEHLIYEFYKSINIRDPHQLFINKISDHINLKVEEWDNTSAFIEYKSKCIMFINNTLTEQQKWQDFGHEMSHYLFDSGCHSDFMQRYVTYREIKADYFAYHFCVPTFMLLPLKELSVYDLMDLFNVEYDFALRRIDMYKSKLLNRG